MKPEPDVFPRWVKSVAMGAMILALLVGGGLFAWWMVARAERDLAGDLQQQARLVAQGLDMRRVQSLTGTEADLASPDYQRIKEQLAAVRSANPQCRFIYLMGRKPDGAVFFFADSEPVSSKDYSPPGQIYEEVPEGSLHAFETKTEGFEGPVPDRWGVWVSPLVPLINPKTGALVAVLGMDIDARTWKWDVAARAAFPIGLVFVLLIGIAATLITSRRAAAGPKPVLWRLLPPLTAMLLVLMICAGLLLWQQHKVNMDQEIQADIADVSGDFHAALDQQIAGFVTALRPIANDADMQMALRERDADRLMADWRNVFGALRSENRLTGLSFLDRDRVCLLRVHRPEDRGDVIDRFTSREAERTGRLAAGLELGTDGLFTLRVVQPVIADGTLVGYVEISSGIEEVLRVLNPRPGNQFVAVIRKEHLDRQKWELNMRSLGRETNWDRLPKSVVIYTSQSRLPEVIAARTHGDSSDAPTREAILDGKVWRTSELALQDASGTEVGDLVILRDISHENADFVGILALGGAGALVLLALMMGFIVILLRRTDAGLLAQQAELRESEQSYRNQFVANSAVMMLLDPADGKIIDANAAAQRFYGYGREELLSLRITDINILPPDEVRRAMDCVTSEKGERFEFRHRLADGSLRDVEVSSSRIQFGGRPVLHTIIQDITARKALESHLLEALDRAESAGRSRSEFLAVMSHELRTPLNGVLGFADLLSETPLDEEQQKYIQTIRGSGSHLLGLVNDILDFSSIEKGRTTIAVAPLSVAELVESAALPIHKTASDKGLEFRCELAPSVPREIFGDERRLRQILINLLGNAVKFTAAGSVILRVEPKFEEWRQILEFSVEDTGPGISRDKIGLLFQPFTQADSTLKRPHEGTGLGLAISHRLAEIMGGSIVLTSTSDKGSIFTFRLPVEVAPAGSSHEPAPMAKPAPDSAGGLVLVVEDDRVSGALASKMLSILGYRVQLAANGQEAVRAFIPGKFSVVLMDMQMPVLDGIEATRAIRGIESTAGGHVRIIALTANVMTGDRERCLEAGMDDFLSKPFKKEELAAKLKGGGQP